MSMPKYLFIALFVVSCPIYAAGAPPTDESVKQLLVATEAPKLVDSISQQMDEMMKSSIQRSLQGQTLTPKQQQIIDNMQSKIIALVNQEMNWNKLEGIYLRVYRSTFTQEEIDGMLAFYKTPAGQSMVKKLPKVMQQTMLEVQKSMGPLSQKLQKIQQDTLSELKAGPAK